MRFDNPIYNHKFVFPDLADFPGLENEYRFYDQIDTIEDIELLKSYIIDNDKIQFNNILSKYTKFSKRLNKHVSKMFDFYSHFENSRSSSSKLYDTSLLTEGYYIDKLDLEEIISKLQPAIDDLYKIKDWIPPIGTMDRGSKVSNNVNEIINKLLAKSNILDIASNYLNINRQLEVGSSYLVVSTPTDNHWKQFLQDQSYVSKTTNLHIDPVENQLKVMIYLNEIDNDSGPFSYIPTSNRWVYDPLQNIMGRAIATGNYCNTPEARQEIFKLPKFLRISYNFGRSLIDSNPLQKMLLSKEKIFTSNDANVILFDPAGMHKGGICNNKHRIAIQVLLK